MHDNPKPKKSLGQHWLEDQASLRRICEVAELDSGDVVVEIGPGKGALTELLVPTVKEVIAIEFDGYLADTLKQRVTADNLTVVNEDCLEFDYTAVPEGYKVVANIPYYLTSNLLRVLSENPNPPALIVLLIQKEVAERVAASPGSMSILAVTVQNYYQTELDIVVEANMFCPPPKVDSQVVVLRRRYQPLYDEQNRQQIFRIVKAGFAQKRKKLKTSLSSGLRLPKQQVEDALKSANVSADCRPQELSLEQWQAVYDNLKA